MPWECRYIEYMGAYLGCEHGGAAAVDLCHGDDLQALRDTMGVQWLDVPRPHTHLLINGGETTRHATTYVRMMACNR